MCDRCKDLTDSDFRVIELIKEIKFGTLLIEIKDGQPTAFEFGLRGLFTRELIPSQIRLIRASQ